MVNGALCRNTDQETSDGNSLNTKRSRKYRIKQAIATFADPNGDIAGVQQSGSGATNESVITQVAEAATLRQLDWSATTAVARVLIWSEESLRLATPITSSALSTNLGDGGTTSSISQMAIVMATLRSGGSDRQMLFSGCHSTGRWCKHFLAQLTLQLWATTFAPRSETYPRQRRWQAGREQQISAVATI